jgi:3-oxoacyl-[acyl-carrier-protein] synthase-1
MRRVVVTGVGVVCSIGVDTDTAWSALKAGQSGACFSEEMKASGLKCWIYAPVRQFRPTWRREQLFSMSMGAQYAATAAQEAIRSARLDWQDIDPAKAGIVIGSMLGGASDAAETDRTMRSNEKPSVLGGHGIVRMMNSTSAANIATYLGFRGRAYSVSSACSTGLDAIGHGYETIAYGIHDVCLCGAAEEDTWRFFGPTFDNWNAMPSIYNGTPELACKPYDVNRAGLVMSAGAGIVVLESLEHAQQRGANVYAELAGYGSANDGKSLVEPTGDGARRSCEYALKTARELGTATVDYINGHGTGTLVGDRVEVRWIREHFAPNPPMLSSLKGAIGHAQGAAAAIETVFTIMMIKHGCVIPTKNLCEIGPDCLGVTHVKSLLTTKVRSALKVAVGLGGTSGCLALRCLDADSGGNR